MLCLFCKISAVGTQTALVAFGFAGLADVAAVEEQPVMRFGDDGGGDVLDELAFCLKGIFAVRRESKAFADTKDMGIDCHCGLVPNDRTDHVRGLTTDSLERLQVIDVIGNDAVVCFHQPLRHLYQVFRFGTGITDGLDVFKDFV